MKKTLFALSLAGCAAVAVFAAEYFGGPLIRALIHWLSVIAFIVFVITLVTRRRPVP